MRYFCRDFASGGSPSEGGEGGAPPELTPQQQHQQYLGDSRPELPPFPEIQWAGNPIPGEESMSVYLTNYVCTLLVCKVWKKEEGERIGL